jgi:hypothetical protein
MKKIFTLLFLSAFALFANAQLQLNTAPYNNANQMIVGGIKVDSVQTAVYSGSNFYDIDFTWHWTPAATTETNRNSVRFTGSPTVVNSFFTFEGTLGANFATYPERFATSGTEYLHAPQTVSTRDGFAVTVKSRNGHIQDTNGRFSRTESGYFSLGASMNSGGDPVWFASVSDLKTYMTSNKKILSDVSYGAIADDLARDDYGQLHEGMHWRANTADFPNGLNTADSALAVVLSKDGNEALAIYPGIFKEIDLRFSFRSDRQQWTRDIEFDVLTIDEGNTGKTATWDIIVSLTYNNLGPNPDRDNTDSLRLGESGAIIGGYAIDDAAATGVTGQIGRRWKAGTYTTGSPVLKINVNKVMGLKPHELFNRTVVIALQTRGTEGATDNATGTYDPIVGIDNIKFGGYVQQIAAGAWLAKEGEAVLPLRATEKGKIAYVTTVAEPTDATDIATLAKLRETYDVDIIIANATADADKPASTFDAYDAIVLAALPGSANVPKCLKDINKPLVSVKPYMTQPTAACWQWAIPCNLGATGSPKAITDVPTGVAVTQSAHPIFADLNTSSEINLATGSKHGDFRVLTPILEWSGDNGANIIPLAAVPAGAYSYSTNPQTLTDIAGRTVIFEVKAGSVMTSATSGAVITTTKKSIHIGLSEQATGATADFLTIVKNSVDYVLGSFTFTGIDKPKTMDSKVIVNKMYFDMLGRQMPETAKGLLIEKVIYEDGSHSARKMFVK